MPLGYNLSRALLDILGERKMTRFSSLSEWEWQICVTATGLQGKVTQTLQWATRFKWCEKSGKHDRFHLGSHIWTVSMNKGIGMDGQTGILDFGWKEMNESRKVYNMYLSFLWFKYSWILINDNWLMLPHGTSLEHLPARQCLAYGEWTYYSLYI